MLDKQVQVNDIVEFVNEFNVPGTGIIAHISSDPDMKPLLIRTANGGEIRIMHDQVTGTIQTQVLDGLISLYFLQQLGRYKQREMSERIKFQITGEAAYSAKEMEVKHEVTLGYYKSFTSSSLAVSLDLVILRDEEDKRYAVKALPAY